MSLPKYFISVDWGTTNFRLRVVKTDNLQVLFELQNDQGVRTLYQQFMTQDLLSQEEYFTNYLNQQIRVLDPAFHSVPTLIAGMASSSIGLQELPYSSFPFDHSAQQLFCQQFSLFGGAIGLLISGVKSETGMMRGEETQAVGLSAYLPPHEQGTLVLPGTHSKHLQYQKGQYVSLQNFITGELFEVLAKHSILSNSVEKGAWNQTAQIAFIEGLHLGFNGQASSSLFTVRAKDILQQSPKTDNYYLLSGLLIGEELSHLKSTEGKIFLAAAKPMHQLYSLALTTLFSEQRLRVFNEQLLGKALLEGQRKILKRYAN